MPRNAESFAAECLAILPGGLLSDDQTRQILSDLFLVVGDAQELYFDPAIEALPDCVDPEECPVVALRGLLSLVGLSSSGAWGWVHSLTEDERRRMAQFAGAIWKTKGLPDGTRSLYRVLTAGLDIAIWDHPFHRWVETDDVPFIGWSDPVDGGAYQGDLHLSDPLTAVDRELLAMAFKAARPAPDVWSLVWCHLVETWLQGLARWDVTGAPVCDVGAGVLEMAPGDALASRYTAAWDTGRLLLSVSLDGAGYIEAWLARVGVDGYRVRLWADRLQVVFVRDGTEVAMIDETVSVVAGLWYLLDVRLSQLATLSTELTVCLDGELVDSAVVAGG